ncbi:MAG: kinesin motor protein cin8 [Piccolia ochrophora]|nr:MAG: kinesin motor protein cin8 [Piccolia ochrophora]
MAGMGRPTLGQPAKRSAGPPRSVNMRPSSTRSQSNTNTTTARSRFQPGALSPANSINTAASRSPSVHRAGKKRKDRDFDPDHGEETNIHVVVRCRGRSDREVRENSGIVLSTDGVKGKTVELAMGPSALSNKTYHFDKVFSPAADQGMIYDEVVTPILDEMLAGYNCTIFAYGQTGTGKTYTMSGDMSDTLGLVSHSAGIIPRVLHSLFSKLEKDETESSVKCSFIELYNEELRDLLSVEENAKLKIYEENSKKGHTTTHVQGVEESHIKTAVDGIKLLQDGSHKRQVAATKCNDLSSRSHTVFTVTVYIKRTTDTGEDFVSAGKLNLVDLAGSENIQRSGAENKRAAEAGLINKSLLTLGRVINALVDRGSHIPYRESKLTRLLQDSLGGRTKTCIIATVSPTKSNVEETISTLDYAFRAKNIRNKPQVNQMISKRTLLRDFTTEIEKLKAELLTTRQKNGVYLSADAYDTLTCESESRRILSEEQRAKIDTMETSLRNKVQELFSLTSNFTLLKKDSEANRVLLDETRDLLNKTEFVLSNTKASLAEETFLREQHEKSAHELKSAGNHLLATLGNAVSDVDGLHLKLSRKSDLQTRNRKTWTSAQTQVSEVTELVEGRLGEIQSHQDRLNAVLSTKLDGFVKAELEQLATNQKLLETKLAAFQASEREVSEQTSNSQDDMDGVLDEIKVLREEVKQQVGAGLDGLSSAAGRISAEVGSELGRFHSQLRLSYTSLGRDFKGIFDELIKHLNIQRAEAEQLRTELTTAGLVATRANAAASARLDSMLADEKRQAMQERQTLMAQIGSLINATGESQDARLASKIGAVQSDITDTVSTFESAQARYEEAMDVWSQKEVLLVDEVLKSRETLKGKLKRDWADANERHSTIHKTTQSIHAETVQIVDTQMKDVDVQMRALDDFVTRAKSHNGQHHDTHLQSLQGLSETVRDSYSSIGNHFTTTYDRVNGLGNDVSFQTDRFREVLSPLNSSACRSLADLRQEVTNARFGEYVPTGTTPEKLQYQHTTGLPKMETNERMIAAFRATRSASSSPPRVAALSPSKMGSMIFSDPTSHKETSPMRRLDVDADNPLGMGSLREVAVNVVAGTLNGEAAASTITNGDMPPPLKRQHTHDSRLPQKPSGKAPPVSFEGRENSTVPSFSSSTGRRLRSNPV